MIFKLFKAKNKDLFSKNEDGAFSSIDLVCQCLIDEDKANNFEKAIKRYIKTDFNVIDFGTGSGILALLAARAGAKKVFAVEYDNFIASVARKNIESNGYSKKIEILQKDARTIMFPPKIKINMVLMEMLTTGMVDEYQIQAINNLHKQNLITKETVLIPNVQETYLTLANTDFSNYGFNLKFIRHFWKHDHNDGLVKMLSEKTPLNVINFSQKISEDFNGKITFTAKEKGKINSLYMTSRTVLTEEGDIYLEDTNSLNASVSIPVDELEINPGDKITYNITYKFGGGYNNFIIEKI